MNDLYNFYQFCTILSISLTSLKEHPQIYMNASGNTITTRSKQHQEIMTSTSTTPIQTKADLPLTDHTCKQHTSDAIVSQ
jgi:hypothetical protein